MTKKKRKKLPPGQVKGPQATPDRVVEIIEGAKDQGDRQAVIVPPEGAGGNQFIRFSAGLYYRTDTYGTTIAKMHEHPLFGQVAMDTLVNWSRQDRWVEGRRSNLENWRKLVENKIGNELVKMLVDVMKGTRQAFDKAVLEVNRDDLTAKSFEGAVRAMVQAGELMMGLQEKLFKTVIPDMPAPSIATLGAGTLVTRTKPNLSVSEARQAAMAILESRRKEMRATLSPETEQPDPQGLESSETDGKLSVGASEASDEATVQNET